MTCHEYGCWADVAESDHKPVYSQLGIDMSVHDWEARRARRRQILDGLAQEERRERASLDTDGAVTLAPDRLQLQGSVGKVRARVASSQGMQKARRVALRGSCHARWLRRLQRLRVPGAALKGPCLHPRLHSQSCQLLNRLGRTLRFTVVIPPAAREDGIRVFPLGGAVPANSGLHLHMEFDPGSGVLRQTKELVVRLTVLVLEDAGVAADPALHASECLALPLEVTVMPPAY